VAWWTSLPYPLPSFRGLPVSTDRLTVRHNQNVRQAAGAQKR
jgi:hypothetical protein